MKNYKYLCILLFPLSILCMEKPPENSKKGYPNDIPNLPTTIIPTEQEKVAHVEMLLAKARAANKHSLVRKIIKHQRAFFPKEIARYKDGKCPDGYCYNLYYPHVGAPAKKDSYSSIHEAAQAGDIDAVKKFIIEDDVDPNTVDANGDSPLHHACDYDHAGVIKELCLAGANIYLANKFGLTPYAIAQENLGVAVYGMKNPNDISRTCEMMTSAMRQYAHVMEMTRSSRKRALEKAEEKK